MCPLFWSTMEEPWISRQETAAYFQVKIYYSICGSLTDIPHIFDELSNELPHSNTALRCDSDALERRYFDGMDGYAWVNLYRLSKSILPCLLIELVGKPGD